MFTHNKNNLLLIALSIAPLWGYAQSSAHSAKYTPCLDYFTVGQSTCQPVAATPVAQPSNPQTLQSSNLTPAQPLSPVDQYLANYGKPPREFVEFYLNPTAENALKWTETYNNLIQRSQALSQSWKQAEQVYNTARQNGTITATTVVGGLPSVTDLGIPLPAQQQAQQPQSQAQPVPSPTQPLTLGAFNAIPSGPTRLTYYFSANCPFCARITPELAQLKQEMGENLAITCADVTPLSPTHRPAPENIAGKLNCTWRQASETEIQSANVRQTPTLLVQQPGQTQATRIAGYLPPEKLRPYLQAPKPQGRLFP